MAEKESKVFAKLKAHLTNIGEYKKFENLFSLKDRTLAEKFGEIWEREDLREIFRFVPPKVLYDRKDDKLAKEFITLGDRYFGEKKYDVAVQSYNLAVLAAKNPKMNEHLESKSDDLSPQTLAYTRRSGLLYEMGKYHESIRDIDKAIEFGYPSRMGYILEQRRANCLFELNKLKEAEKTVKSLLEKEDSSKNKVMITELKELLQKCRNKGTNNSKKQRKDNPIDSTRGGIFYNGEKHPLILKRLKKDKDVNLVSDSVKIDYQPSKGRRLVATRDIEPGELLLAERAYAVASSMTKKHRIFCCVCLRRVLITFPCNTCSLSCYCSEGCMTSIRNVHPLECPVFIHLVESKADPELALAFRTLLKFKMEDILSEVKNNKNATETSVSSLKEAESFFNSPMYFSSLFKLEGNIGKRSGESLLDGVANAVIGVKLLQRIPQFWEKKNPNEAKIEQNLENLKILGGELTKLLLIFQCNIHSMVELCIKYGEKLLTAESIEAGFAVFKKFSMMNHSCNPNALNSCWGDIKYLYSVNFIPKGAEICDSYGERYSSHKLKDRKFSLMKTYHFECECEACEKDWPTFNEICNPILWLCPSCKAVLNSVSRCEHCEKENVESPENEESKSKAYDSKALAKEIAITHKEYEKAYRELNEYKSPLENIKRISKRLSLLSRYSKQPTKDIIEAQELLLRAYDMLGSFSFKGLVLYE